MFILRPIFFRIHAERQLIKKFMSAFDLSYDGPIDYCIAAYTEDFRNMIATASLQKNIIRNVAVLPNYQGKGIVAKLISNIITYGASQGIFHFYVFTKPIKSSQFISLGFRLLATAHPYISLLEIGANSISQWLSKTMKKLPKYPQRAALIMNCNPFTLGHRYLIEYASARHQSVVVFIVEEDHAWIPFSDRLRLARENLSDLSNVIVLPSGPYMISNITFPAYFLKKSDALLAQARLDATLFTEQIAPTLSITHRYVGEEPFDLTTAAYNKALQEILPSKNIQLHVIPRKTTEGSIISASQVRKAWAHHDWQTISRYVSPSTLSFLQTSLHLIPPVVH